MPSLTQTDGKIPCAGLAEIRTPRTKAASAGCMRLRTWTGQDRREEGPKGPALAASSVVPDLQGYLRRKQQTQRVAQYPCTPGSWRTLDPSNSLENAEACVCSFKLSTKLLLHLWLCNTLTPQDPLALITSWSASKRSKGKQGTSSAAICAFPDS